MKTLKELEQGEYDDPLWAHYVPVAAKCERCGGQLYKNTMIVLTTYPAQHQYVCCKCRNLETSFLNLPETDLVI